MSDLKRKILKLQKELKPNWDSYGADPIDSKLVPITLEIAEWLESVTMADKFGVYSLVNGSYQFETYSLDDFCTITIIGNETIKAYVSTGNDEYENDFLKWPDQKDELKRLLDLL